MTIQPPHPKCPVCDGGSKNSRYDWLFACTDCGLLASKFMRAARRTAASFTDRIVARAEFLEQRAIVPGRVPRVRGETQNQQCQQ
jgi:hypothetical protein